MWPMRSHTLVHLTKIMYIKRNFKWMEVEQDGFDKTYPDSWILFHPWVHRQYVNPN